MSRPIDQRIIRLTLDNSDVVDGGRDVKAAMNGILEAIMNVGRPGGLSNLVSEVASVSREFGILEQIAFGALTMIGGQLAKLGGQLLSWVTGPIRGAWAEFDGLLGQQQQIMVNSGRSIEELNTLMQTLQAHANASTAEFTEMVYMTNALAASPWVDWYSLDEFIIGFQTLAYLMASSTDKVRALNNQFIPMMNGLMVGQEVTQAQLAELYNWGLLGVPLIRDMTNQLIEMGKITQENADSINELGAVGGILELQEQLEDGVLLAELLRDGMINVGEEFAHLATTPISLARLMDQISNIQLAGWKRSFELIVGNVVQAREVFGMIANEIIPVVNGFHNWRNYSLEIWQSMGGREHLFGRFAYDTQRITKDMSVWNPYFERLITHAASANRYFAEGVEYIQDFNEELGTIVTYFPDGTKEFTKWSDIAGDMVTYTTQLYHNLRVGSQYTQRSVQQLYELGEIISQVASDTDVVYKLMPRIGAHGEELGYAMQRVESGLEGSTIYTGYITRDMQIWNDELQRYETILAGTNVSMATLSDYFSEVTGVSEDVRVSLGAIGNILHLLLQPFRALGNAIAGALGTQGEGLAALLFVVTRSFYALTQVLMLLSPLFDVVGAAFHVVFTLIRSIVTFILSFLPQMSIDLGIMYRNVQNVADVIVAGLMAVSHYIERFFNGLQFYIRNLDLLWERLINSLRTRWNNFMTALGDNESLSWIADTINTMVSALQSLFGAMAYRFGFEDFAARIREMDSGMQAIATTVRTVFARIQEGATSLGAVLVGLMAVVSGLFGAAGFGLVRGFNWVVGFFTGTGSVAEGAENAERSVASFSDMMTRMGEILSAIGSVIGPAIYATFTRVQNVLNEITFDRIIAFMYALATLRFSKGISDLGGGLGKLSKAMGSLTTWLHGGKDGGGGLEGMVDSFKDSLNGIGDSIFGFKDKVQKSPQYIWAIAGALAVLAGSIFLIAQLPMEQAIPAMAMLAGGMMGIAHVFNMIKANPINAKKILGIAAAITTVSFGLLAMAGAVALLSLVDFLGMVQGVAGVVVLLGALVVAFNKIKLPIFGAASMKNLIFQLITLQSLVSSVMSLAMVVAMLGSLPLDHLVKGVLSTTALIFALTSMSSAISLMPPVAPNQIRAMKTFGLLLAVLTPVVATLGGMSRNQLTKAVLAIGSLTLLMGGMIGFLAFMNKKQFSVELTMLTTLKSLAAALLLVTPVVRLLGNMYQENMHQGIQATFMLTAMMGAVVGLFGVISNLPNINAPAIMAMGAALIALSAALNLMVPVIITLGALPFETVAWGLGAVLAALAILMVTSAIIGKIPTLAAGLIILSSSLLNISLSLNLSAMGFTLLAVALPAFVIAFVSAVAGLLASVHILDQFVVMVGQLLTTLIFTVISSLAYVAENLGMAVGHMTAGIILGLARAAVEIGGALATLLIMIVDVFADRIDELVTSVGNLLITAWESIAGFIWANSARIGAASGLIVGGIVESLITTAINLLRTQGTVGNLIADQLESSMLEGVREANFEIAENMLYGQAEYHVRRAFLDGTRKAAVGTREGMEEAARIMTDHLRRPWYQLDMEQYGTAVVYDVANSIAAQRGLIETVSYETANAASGPFAALGGIFGGSATDGIGDFISGLRDMTPDLELASMDLASILPDELSMMDIESIGVETVGELADVIEAEKHRVTAISGEMAKSIMDEFREMGRQAYYYGGDVPISFGEGMSAHEQALWELGRMLGESGFEGIRTPDFHMAADEHMLDFIIGLNAYEQRVLNAAMGLSEYALYGLTDIDTFVAAQELMYGYALGLNCVGGMTEEINRATQKQAELVRENLRVAPESYEAGQHVISRFAHGILEAYTDATGAVKVIADGQIQYLEQARFFETAEGTMIRFADGLTASKRDVSWAISGIVEGCIDTIQTFQDQFGEEGIQLIMNVAEGIEGGDRYLQNSVRSISGSALETAMRESERFEGFGVGIAESAAEGVNNGEGLVRSAMRMMAEAMINSANIGIRRTNPSQVFIEMGRSIPDSAARGIDNGTPGLLRTVRNLFTRTRDESQTIDHTSTGTHVVNTATAGIINAEPTLRTGLNTIMTNVRDYGNAFDASSIGTEYVNDVSDGVRNRESRLQSSLNTLLTNVRTVGNRFDASSVGRNNMDTVITGMNSRSATLSSTASRLLTSARTAAGSIRFNTVGDNAMRGVEAGAQGRSASSNNVFANLGRGLVSAMNRVLGINSASTVFRQMATYCMMGLEEGFMGYDIMSPIQRLCEAILHPFENLVDDIGDAIGSLSSTDYGRAIALTPKLSLAGASYQNKVVDPRGTKIVNENNSYQFGDTYIEVHTQDNQTAEDTVQIVRQEWGNMMQEEMRRIRRV